MKVGIVGSGFVGSTAAYAMVMQGIGREIVLTDLKRQRADAEAADILHAVPFSHPLQVRGGDYSDLGGSRVVILTAGVNQREGETRLQLLERNAAVFEEIVPQVLRHAPDAVLLVATNPVDIMTHLAARVAQRHGVPAGRVLGSGTTLDTARFRTLIASHVGVDARHVHANVVGEHGDSEVLAWSTVTIGGMPLDAFGDARGCPVTDGVRQEIDDNVRRAAYQIISGKGATYYGIGAALARIVRAILANQRSILTVCADFGALGESDVTLSSPRLVGGEGVLESLPLCLNPLEMEQFRASAAVIRGAIQSLSRGG